MNHSAIILSVAASMMSQAAEQRSAFVDSRDGRSYRAVTIGPLEWMAENLAHASADSRCYADQPDLCAHFGRLYRISDAVASCPAGWRLPSEGDWVTLQRAIGLPEVEMKTINGRGGDLDRKLLLAGEAGFDSVLGGWFDAHLNAYQALGRSAAYWSSTVAGPSTYWHYDLMPARGGIWRSPVDDSYWLSVRCVRGPAQGA